VVKAVDRDETETGVRGLVEVSVDRVTHPVMPEDIPEPAREGAVEAMKMPNTRSGASMTREEFEELVTRRKARTEEMEMEETEEMEMEEIEEMEMEEMEIEMGIMA
ncbi:hypothetical protein Tco_0043407, partial [Tanacetum coccineum]